MTRWIRWIRDATLILMGGLYLTFIAKAFFDNWLHPERVQPIDITSVRMEKYMLRPGDSLFVRMGGKIFNSRCDHIYMLGSIIDEQNKVVQIDKIIELDADKLENLLSERSALQLTPPLLESGNYKFRAEFHEICGSQSYVVFAPLTAFAVTGHAAAPK